MTHNEKLLNALMQFKNSAYEIRDLWEQADSITDSDLCDDYPFDNDFCEVVEKIGDWVMTQNSLLNQNKTN
ncbi:hypothetical protein FTE28_05605 [Bacillus licheniformis]|uniref:hypothetical protein n=1 Tax=Bacillus TaxID=1386 RepID=UPI0003756A1E|nr:MULTISPECIES: hypothetical protein [Bacillus]AMR10775.1 hypothetical protein AB684_11490 [Bacillus licheniformis]ARC67855.1 hypothetical protein B34_00412 [Bacillus licheniformis]KJH58703.1 hypothetical protein UF14_09850 [Bacillus licheniformis]KND06196.1 hypothetical protein ACJ43_17655 [Bacillus paralicheniformis]MCM3374188.1 hypothetical protein [Bacillus licheniformis]